MGGVQSGGNLTRLGPGSAPEGSLPVLGSLLIDLGGFATIFFGSKSSGAPLVSDRLVLVLSCLLTLYTSVMSFGILFPFGLWVSEPGWLLNHSQLV